MSLPEQVKTALDETRTLILGAQVLLGFQYQSAFRERFDTLPASDRLLEACGLGTMLLTVGLLITPCGIHRISERGQDTGRGLFLAGRIAGAAILPFAVGLGLNVAVALAQILHSRPAGYATGVAVGLISLVCWFGVGEMMKRSTGAAERKKSESERGEKAEAPLHALIEQMLTEARVVLPGAQALLGFQLAIVLTDAFEKLPQTSRMVHGLALLLVTLTVILLMTPAALHRIVWAGEDNKELLHIGGFLIGAALLPLALAMAADGYVVFARITGSMASGATAGIVSFIMLIALWYAYPLAVRQSKASWKRRTATTSKVG
jgi:hypothetical protein